METLNKEERNSAFWKFLIMFSVTVIILCTALFFNFRVPAKENLVLKEQNKRLSEEFEFQKTFVEGVQEIKVTLDSINIEGKNIYFMDQLISRKLASLKEQVPDSSFVEQKTLYDCVIQLSLALQASKRELRDLQGMKKLINEYTESLQMYKDELEQAKRDLDICRQLSNSNN